MKAACPRVFEVEALRDARLSGAAALRFQSHLAACAVCACEARALQALALALRSPTSAADADELHVRRERTRLLAAFDASLARAPRRLAPLSGLVGRAPAWLRSAAAVALLSLLAALCFWPARPAPPQSSGAPLARPTEPVRVYADSGAQWSRRVQGRLEQVVLESGVLSIRVDHAASEHSLLVILPDGELEDIGTTFSVSADAGHTTGVAVQEGSVVLRLRGKPALALGAGESWSPPPSPAATPLGSTPPAAPARHRLKATAAATSAPRRSTPEPGAAADFRAAMSAFDSGDNTRAATRFADFLSRHPGDPRGEDAAYLRILALQRTGDSPAARQAAHYYLSRYPGGFRHAEVEALLR